MNRKGLINQIYITLIVIVALMLIMAMYSLGSIVLPIIVGEGKFTASTIQTSIADNGIVEMQNASQVATETTIDALGVVELLVYFGFLGLILGYLLIAYYVRTYPFLAFFWVGAMVIIVIVAMIMSNAYEQSKNEMQLNDYYTTWGTNDVLMTYLPHIMSAVGILGAVILFALISRDNEAEVQRL